MKFDIQKVKKMISNASFKEAIEYIIKFNNSFKVNKSNEIILTSARIKLIEKEFLQGILTISEKNIELIKIGKSLLSIIDQIDEITESEQKEITINKYYSVNIGFKNVYTYLKKHLIQIDNWSKAIFVVDTGERKRLLSKYIDLNYYAIPKHKQYFKEERIELTILDLINSKHDNILLLGQPGSGKTTTTKKLIQDYLKIENNDIIRIPVVIRFRELEEEDYSKGDCIIILKILRILGISISRFKNEHIKDLDDELNKAKSRIINLQENNSNEINLHFQEFKEYLEKTTKYGVVA